MDALDCIVSEHHLIAKGETLSRLSLRADGLRPYLLSQGRWYIRPQFLAGKIDPEPALVPRDAGIGAGDPPEYLGFKITSPNVLSGNGDKLTLAFISNADLKEDDKLFIFPPTIRPLRVRPASDRLDFEVTNLLGRGARGNSSEYILGVSLTQVRA